MDNRLDSLQSEIDRKYQNEMSALKAMHDRLLSKEELNKFVQDVKAWNGNSSNLKKKISKLDVKIAELTEEWQKSLNIIKKSSICDSSKFLRLVQCIQALSLVLCSYPPLTGGGFIAKFRFYLEHNLFSCKNSIKFII